jgi:hypothetical protein
MIRKEAIFAWVLRARAGVEIAKQVFLNTLLGALSC